MTIKKIKRSNIGQIRDRLEKRLKAFEKAHGLKVDIGAMRFTENNVKVSMTLSIIDGESGNVRSPERDDFVLHARKYGLSSALLDKKFSCEQGTFTIVGYRARARKNKFVIQSLRGKKYVCSFFQLRRWLLDYKPTMKYVNEFHKPDYGEIMGESDSRQKELEAEIAAERRGM